MSAGTEIVKMFFKLRALSLELLMEGSLAVVDILFMDIHRKEKALRNHINIQGLIGHMVNFQIGHEIGIVTGQAVLI